MKVGVEKVQDADAHIHVPIQEVQLVGQTLNTFLFWPTHLVKSCSEHVFHFVFLMHLLINDLLQIKF